MRGVKKERRIVVILITGHLGFIGSHLLKLFKEDVMVLDLKAGADIRTCELPAADITHIFHLAARRSVPGGEAEPLDFITTNCWGTLRLLRAYPQARILNISSSAAEESKSVYGATKKFSELVGANHPNCLNVRLYNVFGEGQPLESGAVVPNFIHAKLSGGKPTLRGDGSAARDFTYVGDVALELRRLMFETNDTGLAHVGYGEPMSIRELLHLVFPKGTEYNTEPLGSYEIKFNKAPKKLKKIKFGRIAGLKRTEKWWREQYALSVSS